MPCVGVGPFRLTENATDAHSDHGFALISQRTEKVQRMYQPRALRRVWRAQSFSYWMTQLLHVAPGSSSFDVRRQVGELDNVVGTRAGRVYLAEQYTGWPTREHP